MLPLVKSATMYHLNESSNENYPVALMANGQTDTLPVTNGHHNGKEEVTLFLSREMLAFNSETTGSLISDRFLDEDYDGLDEDEDQLFSLRPIRDEWRQLFDKYDPEGFGEIPLDDFEVALETRDFLEAISPGKLIILQDKAVQFREMGISAVTFQDFVNTLSGKRTLSFKCAMHCRHRQIVA